MEQKEKEYLEYLADGLKWVLNEYRIKKFQSQLSTKNKISVKEIMKYLLKRYSLEDSIKISKMILVAYYANKTFIDEDDGYFGMFFETLFTELNKTADFDII